MITRSIYFLPFSIFWLEKKMREIKYVFHDHRKPLHSRRPLHKLFVYKKCKEIIKSENGDLQVFLSF